jgi:hypothetical protein
MWTNFWQRKRFFVFLSLFWVSLKTICKIVKICHPKNSGGDKHLQHAPGKIVSFFSPLKAYRASNQHALLTCLEMGGGWKRSTSFFPIVILKPLKYKEQLARRGHLSEIIIITMMLFEDTLLFLLVYLKSYTSILWTNQSKNPWW